MAKAKNVERLMRIMTAAASLIEIEASFNAGKGVHGATAAKKELKAAYEDYMQKHARDVMK